MNRTPLQNYMKGVPILHDKLYEWDIDSKSKEKEKSKKEEKQKTH